MSETQESLHHTTGYGDLYYVSVEVGTMHIHTESTEEEEAESGG